MLSDTSEEELTSLLYLFQEVHLRPYYKDTFEIQSVKGRVGRQVLVLLLRECAEVP
jgi:hypothetical protein